MTMNAVLLLKPMESKSTPEAVGPMKAPKAKVDVHKPETRP